MFGRQSENPDRSCGDRVRKRMAMTNERRTELKSLMKAAQSQELQGHCARLDMVGWGERRVRGRASKARRERAGITRDWKHLIALMHLTHLTYLTLMRN